MMVTREEMLTEIENFYPAHGDLVACVLRHQQPSDVELVYWAYKDYECCCDFPFFYKHLEEYARLIVESYKADPVKYARYSPVVKRQLILDMGV